LAISNLFLFNLAKCEVIGTDKGGYSQYASYRALKCHH